MEDELEDKLIYQTFVWHVKVFSRLAMGISVNSSYLNYVWKMFRIYVLKPEVLIFGILIFLIIAYIQNLDSNSKSVFRRLGFSIEDSSAFKNIQLQTHKDGSSWEYVVGNVAVFAVQGRRPHMEDRFVISENIKGTGVSLFAVFDGHGGEFAAEYAAKNLIAALKTRVVEIKNLVKEQNSMNDDGSPFIRSKVPQLVSEDTPHKAVKRIKKTSSHSDDMGKTDIDAVDNDLLEKVEKLLPLSKSTKPLKSNRTVTMLHSGMYLEQNGYINYNKLLTDEVLATDKLLVEAAKKTMNIAGTTALIALIEKKQLIVANVGDSRGVMCDSKGNVIPLSFDHKPQQMREKKRIQEAGGFIAFNGVWRVSGILATSRALGDYPLKDRKYVIAEPDILTFDLSNHKPQFLMFASDGLWDMFTNEEAVAFVREHLHEPLHGAKSITLQAYYKGSLDNITVLIINLSDHNWTDDSQDIIITRPM